MRKLHESQVAVFGISYDSVEVLAAFADKRGITFLLLSDAGSHTIRALGLLNEHLVEQHAFYGVQTRDDQLGVAYPGTFVLDEQGVIVRNISSRATAFGRLRGTRSWGESVESPPPDAPHASSANVEIQAWTDSLTYRPYQQFRLFVELSLPPDVHVFASPVPDGYTPLSLQVDPLDGLQVDQYQMPAPHPFRVEGLDEDFLVHEETVRTTIPLRLTKNLGPTTLTLHVGYQACTPTVCFSPAALSLSVPLNGLDLIRD